MHARRLAVLTAAGALLLSACADDPTQSLTSSEPAFARGRATVDAAISRHVVRDPGPAIQEHMAEINARLAARGANVRVETAEILLAPDAPATMGTTIYANNRTHHLPYFWVPGDERREADGNKLTYLVDESESYAYTRTSGGAPTYLGDAFDSTFTPWTALRCGKLDLVRRPDTGADPTIVDEDEDNPDPEEENPFLADIVVGGFMLLDPGVLGVTYSFLFVDDDGNLTDIDGDGRFDTALAEIWYNLGYYWHPDDPNAMDAVDLQSVAIHENGHALGIGHFGKIFVTNANGKLHFAPEAIMNAAYVYPQQQLKGTDKASYCGNFADWPA